MQSTIKGFILIGMGLFLYSRYMGGTLLYYINERFVWLTLLASVGFIVVGLSYRHRSWQSDHLHEHGTLSWGGLMVVMLPIMLGLFLPPRPLGATAMSNREVSMESLSSFNTNTIKPPHQSEERNILDWLVLFKGGEPTAFDGEEATLIGFVYRDERFAEDTFMVSRFIVSCCAADAAPLGIIVRSDEATSFPTDVWVEVSGHFQADGFDGETRPILLADLIKPTDIPTQPYLYPY